jgi:hypothetical protein
MSIKHRPWNQSCSSTLFLRDRHQHGTKASRNGTQSLINSWQLLLPAEISTSILSAIGIIMFFGSSRAEAFTASFIIRACAVAIPIIAGATLLAFNQALYRKHVKG